MLAPTQSHNAAGFLHSGAGVSQQTVDIAEVDEALYWASIAPTRGTAWLAFVDQLLDARADLTRKGCPCLPHSNKSPQQ